MFVEALGAVVVDDDEENFMEGQYDNNDYENDDDDDIEAAGNFDVAPPPPPVPGQIPGLALPPGPHGVGLPHPPPVGHHFPPGLGRGAGFGGGFGGFGLPAGRWFFFVLMFLFCHFRSSNK